MVCKSGMTCGLFLLAAAHLSAASENRELLQDTYNMDIQRQESVCSKQLARNIPEFVWFPKTFEGLGLWAVGLWLFFTRAS